jgi:hypothetical protein
MGGAAVLSLSVYIPLSNLQNDNERYQAGNKAAAEAKEKREARPLDLDEALRTLIPTLDNKEASVRKQAVDAIAMVFKENAGQKIGDETRDTAARALIDVYTGVDEETPEATDLQRSALRAMMVQVGGQASRDFATELMTTGDDEEKLEVAKVLLEPGSIRGGDISAKALEFARSDAAPASIKPALLRRGLGKKAGDEILALMKKETSPKALKACAVELQNLGKPELMGPVLARLEEAGLLKDVKSMPWFSGKLLTEHIKTADGDELLRALRVVWLRPALTRQTMKSASDRIAHADPQIRRIVARIVPDAVKYEGIDVDSGEELLASRLKVETDPGVKGEIEGSLEQVRQTRRPQEFQAVVPTVQ